MQFPLDRSTVDRYKGINKNAEGNQAMKKLTAKQIEILNLIEQGNYTPRNNDMPSIRSLRSQGLIYQGKGYPGNWAGDWFKV